MNGRLDPTINMCLNWLENIEDYFEWYEMTGTQQIHFCKN